MLNVNPCRFKASAVLISSTLLAVPQLRCWAQAAEAETAGSSVIESILVTAQKREQSAQDVPIAVTAFSGEQVRAMGWDNPVDIIAQTPNISGYSIFGNAFPLFYIRGIGTNDPGHAAQSPVGVYTDEVYHSSLAGLGFALFDLERVEVLRGPQGTLWGKNTTGGAMHFVSTAPTHEPQGYTKFRFGQYNDDTPVYDFEGALSASLSDDVLAARVAVKAQVLEDWITNEIRQGGPKAKEGLGGFTEYAGRLSLLYTPGDSVTANFRATLGRRDGDHLPLHQQPVDNPNSFFRHGGYTENPAYDVQSLDRTAPEIVEYESVSLGVDIDVGGGTLTSITGYSHSYYFQDADVDGTPFDGLFGPFQADSRQVSQELRFASAADKAFRWIGGVYAFREDMDGFNYFLTGAELNNPQFDIFTNSGFGNNERRERESTAVFGAIELDFAGDWTLGAGIRYTRDEEDFIFKQLFWPFIESRGVDDVPDANDALETFNSGDLNESWSEVTGDLTLTYALNGQANVYGKFSSGYLGGNHVLPITGSNFGLVDPENVDAFELGFKSTLLDGRLQLNTAVFHYDYTNMQVTRGFTTSGQGSTFISIRQNAAESTVQGAELEFKYAPVTSVYLAGGLGYTDASFDSFTSERAGGGFDDFSGRPIPNVPEVNANLLMSYTIDLGSGAELELSTDWNYQDEFFIDSNFRDTDISESRTIGNVDIRYHAANGRWTASAYARNVANEIYIVNRRDFSNALEAFLVIFNEPRVIGLSLDMKF